MLIRLLNLKDEFVSLNIERIQNYLVKENIDGWLIYDFRHSNHLAYPLLDLKPKKTPSRRFFFWIPAQGQPIKIVSPIEAHILDSLPGETLLYDGWQNLNQILKDILPRNQTIAMEYSPMAALPAISCVDAGTIEWIKSLDVHVVSSSGLLQVETSVWSQHQLESHLYAAQTLEKIVDLTWQWLSDCLKIGDSPNEYQTQQKMLSLMNQFGCYTQDPPTCAVNENSADPHYSPPSLGSHLIEPGDWVLLDLWCKKRDHKSVYADITRVGYMGSQIPEDSLSIFTIVKRARDAGIAYIESKISLRDKIEGWELDKVCREVIKQAGYEKYFVHRTGHHIGEHVHGPGANLDNWETHDTRPLLNETGFSIEPGIYLPGKFGVRLESDIYITKDGNVQITGGLQDFPMTIESGQ